MMKINENRLTKLLSFTDKNVISRFRDTYDISETEAQDILSETLKFIHISQIPGVFISDDLLILDEMWHNLILFTPLYHEFSLEYMNIPYLHHIPATKVEKDQHNENIRTNYNEVKKKQLKKLEVLLSATYNHLGEETVEKWFRIYPKKYSKENIEKLRKL